MTAWSLRVLESPTDMKAVEDLQGLVWPGSPVDVVPDHLLITLAHNGCPVIGAFMPDAGLIGFVFGFPGLVETDSEPQFKYCSHQMGVHPDFEGKGIGFALKRAQAQMARQQGYQQVTWTYDPLLSRNAYLNIAKLGAVCNTYKREVYGEMRDGLNVGFPSDRFQVDWWISSHRVEKRLSESPPARGKLNDYLAKGGLVINPGNYDQNGNIVTQPFAQLSTSTEKILLVEIPSDYQSLKKSAPEAALAWRYQTREIFETAFRMEYLVTDFLFERGAQPRSYYVLVHVNNES